MFRKIVKILVVSSLFMTSFAAKTNAQEMITPEKKALIKELLEVTEAKQMAENFTNMLLLQMEKNYPQMMSQAISEAGIPRGKEQEELKKKFTESQLRFSRRFRELYPQRVNLAQVVEEVYYPLYDKYFTEEELEDLIVFSKSSTGQKWIKVAPQLMQESMQRSSELINPKIIQLVNEILQEEKERLLKIQESIQEQRQ